MAEGYRMALTPQLDHMAAAAIYGALVAFIGLVGWIGVRGFSKRVLG
jgi:ABC-2 type transport system permease protein